MECKKKEAKKEEIKKKKKRGRKKRIYVEVWKGRPGDDLRDGGP